MAACPPSLTEIPQMKNKLAGDTAENLLEDRKFIADFEKNCAGKGKPCEENVSTAIRS